MSVPGIDPVSKVRSTVPPSPPYSPYTGDSSSGRRTSIVWSLSGAVIVSTPQDIALLDARKGLNMFKKVDVPVFGIVENMSYYVCPKCGDRAEIFGHGGARDEAENLGVPYLGGIPLDIEIRETSDSGMPIVAGNPDSEHSKAYMDIAGRIKDACEAGQIAGGMAEGPAIRFD